ncbi:MAG: M24 family metallopeptidase [Ilumatobacteraceae bacterium]
MTAPRARSVASTIGAEVILLARLDDVRWMTGFTGGTGWAVFDKSACRGVLMVDGRYGERAMAEVANSGAPFDVEVSSTSHDDRLSAFVGSRTVAVDPTQVSAARMSAVRARSAVVEEPSPLDELRRTKDPVEISHMERAAAIADAALAEVVADGLCGRTERQIRNRLEMLMRESGADEPAFPTIVATGANGARPHHEPGDAVVCDGDAVVIDMGARVSGYRSDMTRTVLVGRVDDEMIDMFNTVTRAQAAGLATVRTGVAGSEVDGACRAVFREVGCEHEFLHGTGHGVGLAIHEHPILGPRCATTLLSSEVVTVEPGLYRVGSGGVRIEDLVVVEEHGHRLLTRTPKDLTCPPSARMI